MVPDCRNLYMLLIPSIPPRKNTLARVRDEFIVNWHIPPDPDPTPSSSLSEKQSSTPFALDTSKEASGLPNAVFEEVGV